MTPDGKLALVTGASSGIGAATARAWADADPDDGCSLLRDFPRDSRLPAGHAAPEQWPRLPGSPRGFAEALRSDLTGSGIGVTLYGSGVVRSPYREHNPGSLERVPWVGSLVPALTPEAAARAIVRGIRREKRLVVVPFMMRLTYWMHALFPGVVQWLMTRTGYPRPPV